MKAILLKKILLKAILLKAILLTALLGMSLIVACKQPSAPKEEPSDPKPKPTPKVYKQPVLDSIFADRMRPGELELFGRFDSASARVVIGSTTLMIRSKDSTHILCTLPIIGRGSAGPVTVQDSGGTSNTKLLSMWGFSYYSVYGRYIGGSYFNKISDNTYLYFMRFDIATMLRSNEDSVEFTIMDYAGIDTTKGILPDTVNNHRALLYPKDSSLKFYRLESEIIDRLQFNRDLSLQSKDTIIETVPYPFGVHGEWRQTFTQFLPK